MPKIYVPSIRGTINLPDDYSPEQIQAEVSKYVQQQPAAPATDQGGFDFAAEEQLVHQARIRDQEVAEQIRQEEGIDQPRSLLSMWHGAEGAYAGAMRGLGERLPESFGRLKEFITEDMGDYNQDLHRRHKMAYNDPEIDFSKGIWQDRGDGFAAAASRTARGMIQEAGPTALFALQAALPGGLAKGALAGAAKVPAMAGGAAKVVKAAIRYDNVIKGLPRYLQAGTRMAPFAAAMRLSEGLTEGGETANEAQERGRTASEISEAARSTVLGNMGLMALDIAQAALVIGSLPPPVQKALGNVSRDYLGKIPLKVLKSAAAIGVAAGSEGSEEAIQEEINSWALSQGFDPKVVYNPMYARAKHPAAFNLGALMGLVQAGVNVSFDAVTSMNLDKADPRQMAELLRQGMLSEEEQKSVIERINAELQAKIATEVEPEVGDSLLRIGDLDPLSESEVDDAILDDHRGINDEDLAVLAAQDLAAGNEDSPAVLAFRARLIEEKGSVRSRHAAQQAAQMSKAERRAAAKAAAQARAAAKAERQQFAQQPQDVRRAQLELGMDPTLANMGQQEIEESSAAPQDESGVVGGTLNQSAEVAPGEAPQDQQQDQLPPQPKQPPDVDPNEIVSDEEAILDMALVRDELQWADEVIPTRTGAIVRKNGLDHHVKVVDFIDSRQHGEAVAAHGVSGPVGMPALFTLRADGTFEIQLARGFDFESRANKQSLGHEAFHAAKKLGLLTKAEIASVYAKYWRQVLKQLGVKASKMSVRQALDADPGAIIDGNVTVRQALAMTEEKVADNYGNWAPSHGRILDKIWNWVKRMASYDLRDAGSAPAAADVYRRLRSGQGLQKGYSAPEKSSAAPRDTQPRVQPSEAIVEPQEAPQAQPEAVEPTPVEQPPQAQPAPPARPKKQPKPKPAPVQAKQAQPVGEQTSIIDDIMQQLSDAGRPAFSGKTMQSFVDSLGDVSPETAATRVFTALASAYDIAKLGRLTAEQREAIEREAMLAAVRRQLEDATPTLAQVRQSVKGVKAAIWTKRGVYTGNMHLEALIQALDEGALTKKEFDTGYKEFWLDGFLFPDGEFLDREETQERIGVATSEELATVQRGGKAEDAYKGSAEYNPEVSDEDIAAVAATTRAQVRSGRDAANRIAEKYSEWGSAEDLAAENAIDWRVPDYLNSLFVEIGTIQTWFNEYDHLAPEYSDALSQQYKRLMDELRSEVQEWTGKSVPKGLLLEEYARMVAEPQTKAQVRGGINFDTRRFRNNPTTKFRTVLEVGEFLQEELRRRAKGIELSPQNKADYDRAIRWLTMELTYQLETMDTGQGWYDQTVDDAIDIVNRDLDLGLNDETSRSMFRALLAITSAQTQVDMNLSAAIKIWMSRKGDGKFILKNPYKEPGEDSYWTASTSSATGLDILNKLMDQRGEKGAVEFLMSAHAVKDLRQIKRDLTGQDKKGGGKVGIEANLTDPPQHGAFILGPKVGAFFLNMSGVDTHLTADMWVSRTYNRLFGDILTPADQFAEQMAKFEVQTLEKKAGLRDRVQAKRPSGLVDAPRSKSERALMTQMWREVGNELGLSLRDTQAVLWYYEQYLYNALGTNSVPRSFKDAAERIKKEGFDVRTGYGGKDSEADGGGEAAQIRRGAEGREEGAGAVKAQLRVVNYTQEQWDTAKKQAEGEAAELFGRETGRKREDYIKMRIHRLIGVPAELLKKSGSGLQVPGLKLQLIKNARKVALDAFDDSTKGQVRKLKRSPEFTKLFAEAAPEMFDEDGEPIMLFHGTFHDIEQIDLEKASPNGYLGRAFYGSTSPADVSQNYANQDIEENGDLQIRMDHAAAVADWTLREIVEGGGKTFADAAKQLASDHDFKLKDSDMEFIKKLDDNAQDNLQFRIAAATTWATERIAIGSSDGGARIYPVFMAARKPIVMAAHPKDSRQTHWDVMGDGGPVHALENVLADIGADPAMAVDEFVGNLYDMDVDVEGGRASARAVYNALRHCSSLWAAYEISDQYTETEIARMTFDRMGYDSVIMDAEVFSNAKNLGAQHFITWKPTNVKSVFAERPTRDTADIMAQVRPVETHTDSEAFRYWFGDSRVVGPDGKPMLMYHGRSRSTADAINFFDLDRATVGQTGLGFYFASLVDVASVYMEPMEGRPHGQMYPVYLSIQNPLEWDQLIRHGSREHRAILDAIDYVIDHPSEGVEIDKALRNKMRERDISGKDIAGAVGVGGIRKVLELAGYDGIHNISADDIGSPSQFDPEETEVLMGDKPFGETWMALYREQIKSLWNAGTWSPVAPEISAQIRQIAPPPGMNFMQVAAAMDADGVNNKLLNPYFAGTEIRLHYASLIGRDLQKKIAEIGGQKGMRGRYKYGQKARDLAKALHVYIDLQREPGAYQRFYGKLSTYQKEIADMALNEVANDPRLVELAGEISDYYDAAFREAQKYKIVHNQLDNYVNRVWKLNGKSVSESNKTFGTASRHRRKRKLPTILQGWADGLEMAAEDAVESLVIYLEETGRAIENKALIDRMRTMRLNPADPDSPFMFTHIQPKGYNYKALHNGHMRYWVFDGTQKKGEVTKDPGGDNYKFLGEKISFRRFAIYKPGGKVARRVVETWDEAVDYIKQSGDNTLEIHERWENYRFEKLYAPAELADDLNNITSEGFKSDHLRWALKWNARIKKWILLTSLFHHMAFSRSFWLGTHGKPFDAQGNRFSKANIWKAWKEGVRMMEANNADVELLVANGLTIGRMQEWDEALAAEKTRLGKWLDDHGKVSREFKNFATELWQRQAHFLFKEFGAGLKVQSALIELATNRMKYGNTMSEQQIAQYTARLINEDFGGMNWNRLGVGKKTQQIARTLLLAPDWTSTNFFTIKRLIEGLMGKGKNPKEVREIYGRFWVGILMKGLIATTALNVIMGMLGSLGDDDKQFPENIMHAFKDDWRRLLWTGVDITPVYKFFNSEDDGRRRYFSIFGHFKDPVRWAIDPIRSGIGKGSPIARFFLEAAFGSDWKGDGFTTLSELLGTDDKGYYKSDGPGRRAGDPKGGQLKGKLTSPMSEPGALGWEQLPSYLLSQMTGSTPVQVQEYLSVREGQKAWFDALLRMAGMYMSPSGGSEFDVLATDVRDMANEMQALKLTDRRKYAEMRRENREKIPLITALDRYEKRLRAYKTKMVALKDKDDEKSTQLKEQYQQKIYEIEREFVEKYGGKL